MPSNYKPKKPESGDSPERVAMCLICPWKECINCLGHSRWGTTEETTRELLKQNGKVVAKG